MLSWEKELEELALKATDAPILDKLNPSSGTYQIQKGWTVGNAEELKIESFGKELLKSYGYTDTPFWINPFGNGSSSITPYGIAMWAVAQARLRPARRVLQDLQKLFKDNNVNFNEYVGLWGVSIQSPINVGIEGIQIIPVDNLTPSEFKDKVTRTPLSVEPIFNSHLESQPLVTAVLARSLNVKPIITSKDDRIEPKHTSLYNLMSEIGGMLVVVAKTPVIPFIHSIEAQYGTPYILSAGGGSSTSNPFISMRTKPHVDLTQKLVQEFVKPYLSMSAHDKEALKIPLSRLNSSLSHYLYRRNLNDFTEAAIDLGIAMETFLLPDKGEGITYRFALRGALWLEGNVSENRKELKKIYGDLRSSAAHTGKLSKKNYLSEVEQKNIIDLFDKAYELFIQMLRKAIKAGKIPKWEDIEEKL